ncbi:hypothetical protein F5Y12DRAFT_416027 [Xylaria sp. FL1777]|nr:hypothetical protein F5Y12DRAFT_416027 [Xylaria sp. FL1777]
MDEVFLSSVDERMCYTCCNFPDFIRVKYTVRGPEGSFKRPGFEDIRTFEVQSYKIPGNLPSGTFEVPESKMGSTRRIYSLIACVFERNDQDKKPVVRTYTLDGKPIIPRTPWEGDWEKKIGMQNTTCFLFYAMCHRYSYRSDNNPLNVAGDAETSNMLQQGGIQSADARELPNFPPKRIAESGMLEKDNATGSESQGSTAGQRDFSSRSGGTPDSMAEFALEEYEKFLETLGNPDDPDYFNFELPSTNNEGSNNN